MADDRELLREVWDGKIPICFTLAAEDLVLAEQPDSFYFLVSRQSYFPLVTDKVQRHFAKFINSEKACEMWLDLGGVPLRWHYPIGVLFDLHGSDSCLPWNLTVHFQNFPEHDLLRCPSREAVESHYMAMVKEADSLKHRGQVVNAMQKKDHKQLWTGLQNDKFEQFWSVNRKLMERTNDELFKYIPFRVYQGDGPFIQRLVRPITDAGQGVTLGELLQQVVSKLDEHNVCIQGIAPPFDTSLQWLSEHLSHPDNFLHICVLPSIAATFQHV